MHAFNVRMPALSRAAPRMARATQRSARRGVVVRAVASPSDLPIIVRTGGIALGTVVYDSVAMDENLKKFSKIAGDADEKTLMKASLFPIPPPVLILLCKRVMAMKVGLEGADCAACIILFIWSKVY